jgi:predicted Fe-S protein YdhL (DUF1289 family)
MNFGKISPMRSPPPNPDHTIAKLDEMTRRLAVAARGNILRVVTVPIWSPCKKICIVDPNEPICAGCFRTLEELGRWTQMSRDEHLQIKAELADREERYRAEKSG